MFSWLGDVFDWVCDGVGWVWDHTLGAVIGGVGSAIWDTMFKWLFETIYKAVAKIFQAINNSATDVFELSWVQAFVKLFYNFGWMLFACGVVVAVFDCAVAYENGSANIKRTSIDIIKGFMAVSLFAVLPQQLYSLCVNLQGSFSVDLIGIFLNSTTKTVASTAMGVLADLIKEVSLFSLFFIVLLGYATVKVIFANIKRGGALLCQIAIGSLYMFSIPRGYTEGFQGWCKQVIATCMTAFLQTTILYLGLLTYSQHPLMAMGLCLSSTEVPKVAQMFGLDTSVRINMMSVSHTLSMGSKLLGKVK